MKVTKLTLPSMLTVLLLSAGTLQLCTGQDVAYNVFSLPNCVATQQSQNHVLNEQPPPIGFCQNLGMGRAAYNSIEILGCSSTCLCFKQYASQNANDMCNPASRGQNVKMSCTNKCLQDCNGVDCGDTALPDSGNTRLMLTGSGQLCASPVADEDFVCETTGMIKDSNGNFVDDFATGASPTASPTDPPTASPTESPTPPTTSSSCEDSPLRLKIVKDDGKKVTRDCGWVAKKKGSRCSLDGVSGACPFTCGSCDTCEDTTLKMKIVKDNGKKVWKTCSPWVAKRPGARCSYDGVSAGCRVTCDVCGK